MIKKQNPIRSKKIREAARGQSCVRCGAEDGTVVLAHYTGIRQHAYGKGMRIKGHDFLGAELCLSCHERFDKPEMRKSIAASEEFLHLIALTWRRWISDGVIQIRGAT